jgi:hypothetical protein
MWVAVEALVEHAVYVRGCVCKECGEHQRVRLERTAEFGT